MNSVKIILNFLNDSSCDKMHKIDITKCYNFYQLAIFKGDK